MNAFPARRDRWARFTPEQQTALIEDDLDGFDSWKVSFAKAINERLDGMEKAQREGFNKVTWYMFGIMASLTTASFLLAVNILLGRF